MTTLLYAPLLVFQLVLLLLFVMFVNYGDKRGASVRGFEDTHVMIFIGFAYLMTFLKKYCYSALGFNLLLAALCIQWAIFCQGAWEMEDNKIFITKKSLLEADIMAVTALITFGALLGLASGTQLLFLCVIEIAAACTNLHILKKLLWVSDIGGSIGIHTFGAYFGLGASAGMRMMKPTEPPPPDPETLDKPNLASDISAMIGKSSGLWNPEPPPPPPVLDESTYISDITTMIGSLFLWIFWPSFNSALASTDAEYQRAIINTYLSLAACTVTTFVMSAAVHHKFGGKLDIVHIQNSTLAGGVAVGAVANMYIGPGVAIAIGIGAAMISVLGYRYLTPLMERVGIQDTCGVHNLHGMPGLYSGFLSVLFASVASYQIYGEELEFVFPAVVHTSTTTFYPHELTTYYIYLRAPTVQAEYQLLGMGTTLGIALIAGLVSGFIARTSIFSPLQVKERYDDEVNWELP